MADIKQAAKWLQEGEYVRRKVERRYTAAVRLESFPSTHAVDASTGRPRSFSLDDILAEDWEVVE